MIILTSILGFLNKKTVYIILTVAFFGLCTYVYNILSECSQAGLKREVATEKALGKSRLKKLEFKKTQESKVKELVEQEKKLTKLFEERRKK